MYEYKVVNLEVKGIFLRKLQGDLQSTLDKEAKEGWRLVQVLNTSIGSTYGATSRLQVIFEKKIR